MVPGDAAAAAPVPCSSSPRNQTPWSHCKVPLALAPSPASPRGRWLWVACLDEPLNPGCRPPRLGAVIRWQLPLPLSLARMSPVLCLCWLLPGGLEGAGSCLKGSLFVPSSWESSGFGQEISSLTPDRQRCDKAGASPAGQTKAGPGWMLKRVTSHPSCQPRQEPHPSSPALAAPFHPRAGMHQHSGIPSAGRRAQHFPKEFFVPRLGSGRVPLQLRSSCLGAAVFPCCRWLQ